MKLFNLSRLRYVATIATATATLAIATNSAIAREITTAEAMSLTTTIEGFNSVLSGLQTLQGFDSGAIANWSIEYTSSGATFSSTGTLNNLPLNINYSGILSGVFGVENLTWVGNWTGSLGTNFISATDSATFLFDNNSSGYSAFDFGQDGNLNASSSTIAPLGLFNWFVRGTEVLGGIAVGVGVGVSTGNPWLGVGSGIGSTAGLLSLSNYIVTPDSPPENPPRPPLPPSTPISPVSPPGQQTIVVIGGTNNSINKNTNLGGGIQVNITGGGSCTISCNGSGTVLVSTPEPTSILSFLFLGSLGVGAILKHQQIFSKSTGKDLEG